MTAPAPRPLQVLLRRPLAVGLAALLVVTATTLALTALLLARLAPAVTRADDVLSALQDGHVAMVNQETGLRGFLVSRDQQFLEPYHLGVASLRQLDARLAAWGTDDPALAADVRRLRAAERAWADGWVTPLLAWQPDVADKAGLTDLLLRGKRLFDAYRAVEARVRADVGHERDVAVGRQRDALLTGAAVDLAVALVVALAVRRANRRLSDALLPPVRGVRDSLAALTAGDLDRSVEETGPAELRAIAGDVTRLGQALRDRDALVAAREGELVAARDEAERAGSAKTAFLATMSHEIRTPLNAVLGLTDLLLTTGLTEEQRTHLETISGSGDSLLTLINDVLDFSKIEAGELDLDQAPFDLADLVYDVAQLLAPQAAGKGLDLLVDLPLDCPWQVVGDGPRLRQVVMNLVGNAVKFTAHGVVIIRVAAEARGDRLSCRVAVSDTGIGIPADRRDRLFRSFSQVDASTTRSYGGTGLGLAISQRIARAMGGDITVDSEPGVGSTFTVAVELGVPAGAGVVDASGSLAGRRLLVVDDNPTNLKILGHQLARYGAEVVPAGGGAEALAAVTEQGDRLDAAILDLHMPGMAGDELAARLRALPVAAGLPLILLSSSTALDRQVWATFAARLHKPVRPDRLLRTVRSVLSAGDAEAAPDRRPEPASATGPRLRVLVAEDNAVNARLMELYLRQLGHDCVHVPNGEQAVTAVLGGGFDVVLMDAQMPVLGGVDATAAIRSVPGPQPRIVAVTASVLDSDRTAFLEAGADAFVAKPVRLATLAQALEVWDGEERRRTPAQPWTGVEHRGPVPGPAPAPAAVLDEETVEELRDLGDEGFGHLYRQYLTGLESTVAAILDAAGGPPLDPDDDGSLHRLAHRLKGSSAAMGATTVAEVCRRLEDGSGGDLDAELRTLREESERVRAAVTSLLAAG